jgi:LruC domain-containing protein
MKKIIISILFLAFTLLKVSAQTLTLTCEDFAVSPSTSNNRNYDIANCWGFGGVTYTTSSKIDGNYSTQSGAASNLSPTSFWIKSPWFKPGSGNINFKTRLSNSSATSRFLTLAYIPYDNNASFKEGTRVNFFTHTFTINSSVVDLSQAMPAAIANSGQPFKIMVLMYGSGGTSRIMTDSWQIPGTYWADPSNSCFPLSVIADADSDGVADADDAYPNDATKAYNNYFPASGFGTLMFEDLWPATGDYDFNDLVLDYRYNLITNANNKVVEMDASVVTRAIGASFRNGFAFQMNGIAPNKIVSTTGPKYHGASWLNNAANGTENGQTYANIIVFDDAQKVLPSPGGSGTNVIPANGRVAPDTTSLVITFITSSGQELQVSDFNLNPYIIVNQIRGKEVHLPNGVPTTLHNSSWFGTFQDDSKPGEGKYYKTKNNLPWALSIESSIPYTHTTNDLIDAYLKFADWAQSNGTLYTDWYENKPGYRDANKLFVP